MSNWNMPPGVSTNQIPGNGPEDEELDPLKLLEELLGATEPYKDQFHMVNRHIWERISAAAADLRECAEARSGDEGDGGCAYCGAYGDGVHLAWYEDAGDPSVGYGPDVELLCDECAGRKGVR